MIRDMTGDSRDGRSDHRSVGGHRPHNQCSPTTGTSSVTTVAIATTASTISSHHLKQRHEYNPPLVKQLSIFLFKGLS